MKKTFIFGHKKPDTDSVTAAIALSYLKNKLGENTEPRILGDINRETEFVLDHFKIKSPKYLNDVKLQIKDLKYEKNIQLTENESIYNSYIYMLEHNISTLPIIDENKNLLGLLSMKDIAKDLITGDLLTLNSSYNDILDTLDANTILKFDDVIQGDLSIASYRSSTFIDTISINNNTILIVGDRHSIIEYAIENKAKMIILSGNSYIKEEHIKAAREKHVNIIRTNLNTFEVAKRISLCSHISSIVNREGIITFNENDYVNDFLEMANKYRYSIYPVLNQKNQCLGVLRLSDVAAKDKKQVILVDHNESSQSIDGLEEAEIVEIIDHHKIGTIGTSMPINFRNMPVGSSNTIIYQLYQENKIDIPKDIAGLMLSGIISDTLLLKSPTTTNFDIDAVHFLAKKANIDYETYGMDMFKAGSSLKGKTREEILYTDFKNFMIEEKKVGIGQVFTLNIEEIQNDTENYIALLDEIAENNDYYIIGLFVTDIIQNGSYLYYNNKAKDILESSFDIQNLTQGYYLPNIVSRKKQMIPNIMDAMEK